MTIQACLAISHENILENIFCTTQCRIFEFKSILVNYYFVEKSLQFSFAHVCVQTDHTYMSISINNDFLRGILYKFSHFVQKYIFIRLSVP